MIDFLKKKRKINEIIGMLCFFIYGILAVFINSYIVETEVARMVVNIIRILLIFYLLFDSINLDFYKRREYNIAYLLIVVASLIIFAVSKRYQLLFFCVFIFWCSKKTMSDIFIVSIISRIIGVLIVMSLAWSGAITNIEVTRYMQTNVRYGMGFIAPALASGYLLHTLLALIVLRKFKLNVFEYVFYAVFNLALFFLTDTRFETIIIFGLLLVSFVCSHIKMSKIILFFREHQLVKLLFVLLPIIFLLANVLILLGYRQNISLFVTLANKMSSRVQYTISAYELSGLTLFGNSINVNDYNIVLDSSYFKSLLETGIVGLCIMLYCYYNLINRSFRTRNMALLFVVVVILLENVFSPFSMDYNYNIIVLLSLSVYRRKGLKSYAKRKLSRHSCSYLQQENFA